MHAPAGFMPDHPHTLTSTTGRCFQDYLKPGFKRHSWRAPRFKQSPPPGTTGTPALIMVSLADLVPIELIIAGVGPINLMPCSPHISATGHFLPENHNLGGYHPRWLSGSHDMGNIQAGVRTGRFTDKQFVCKLHV